MASNLSAYIEVIGSNASRFPNTTQCDLAIYTDCNAQSIHLGVMQNSNSTLRISDKTIAMTTSVIATGSNANALSNIKDASSNWYTLSNGGTFSICNISPNGNSNGSIFLGSNGFFVLSNNGLPAASNIAHSNILSTSFVIEAWVNLYSPPLWGITGYLIGNMTPNAGLNNWCFGINTNRQVSMYTYASPGGVPSHVYTSNLVPLNRWTHIAVTYSNPERILRLFINGVVQSNLTSSTAAWTVSNAAATGASNVSATHLDVGNGYVAIGRYNTSNMPLWLHDLKFVTGTYYTPSNPPPAPFPLTSGTRLLLRAPLVSSLVVPFDVSSNWATLSNVNSISNVSLSFSNTSNGSIDLGNGFITFPSNGLSANSNIAHCNIISTDFVIESWVRFYNFPGLRFSSYMPIPIIGHCSPTTQDNLWSFGVNSNMQLSFFANSAGSTTAVYTQSNTIPLNTWVHVGVSYSNAPKSMSFYLNGVPLSNLTASNLGSTVWSVASASATAATAPGLTMASTAGLGSLVSGRYFNSNLPCFIHDLKFVTGAWYAPSNPPVFPTQITPGTRLLLRMANITTLATTSDLSSNFIPLSNVGFPIIYNIPPYNNAIDISNTYFSFSNTGNPFPSSNIAHSNLIATDFLIESWVNYYATPSNPVYTYIPSLIGNMLPNSVTNYWSFGVTSLRELCMYIFQGGAIYTQANTIPLNTWTHVAVSYSNNEKRLRLFVNGVPQSNITLSNVGVNWVVPSASSTFASNIGMTHMNVGQGLLTLGRYNNSNNPCYIHDLKFVTGTTYTPSNPPPAFASVTPGTRLLLRAADVAFPQNTGQISNSLFIAANGNVGINTSNPQFALDVNGSANITGTLRAPGQPYYCAQIDNANGTVKNVVIGFSSNAQTNVPQSYAGNVFTAPVSGVYLISITSILGAGSGQAGNQTGSIYIRRNGVNITHGHWNCNDAWENVSAQYAVQLNRNDTIDVFVVNSSGVWAYAGGATGSHGTFSAIMIG